MSIDYVTEIVKSGLEPFTFFCRPIAATETHRVFAYRSMMQINSLTLGALRPEQYGVVAARSVQCVRLAKRQLLAVCTDLTRRSLDGPMPAFISVPVPVRMLTEGTLVPTLTELFKRLAFDTPAALCVEFPPELLYEAHEATVKALVAVRATGVLTALADFGEESCPVLSAYGLPLDYVFLAPSVTEQLKAGSGIPETVTGFAARGGRTVVFETLESDAQIRAAAKCGAGAYMTAAEPIAVKEPVALSPEV